MSQNWAQDPQNGAGNAGFKAPSRDRAGQGFGLAEAKDDYGNLQDLGFFWPKGFGFRVFVGFVVFWALGSRMSGSGLTVSGSG